MSNESPKGNEKNLNWRQSKFVAEFVEHGNATQAAQTAGYSHPKQQGSRLLTHVDVKAAIEAHKRQMMARAVDGSEWVVERLKVEAMDPENSDAARVRSLELMGKHYGIFAPEKQQIETVSSGFFADLQPEEEFADNVLPFRSETCDD